jgi:hypothetical protein
MVHLAPTTKLCTSSQAAKLFAKHVECLHGLPRVLISDRDSRFTSDFWKNLHEHLGVTLSFSSAYHPQSDGQTERANKVVGEVLRNLSDQVPNWDDLLPYVEFSINNSKSASTQETPFYLNYGCHPRTHVTNQLPAGFRTIPLLEAQFRDRDDALARVKLLLRQAQDRQKSYADLHRQPHPFAAGDYVLLNTKNFRLVGKGVRKLYPKFVGPFPILEMVGTSAARLELPSAWHLHDVFHVSLLRPFRGDPPDQSQLPQAPVEDGIPCYEVEAILSHDTFKVGNRSHTRYLIKWKGFPAEHNSYLLASEIPSDLLADYQSRL